MKDKGIPGWKALGFESYEDYLKSNFWREKRKIILDFFDNRCAKCGTTKQLLIHHLNYINVGNEGKNDVTVICWDCHTKIHRRVKDGNGSS